MGLRQKICDCNFYIHHTREVSYITVTSYNIPAKKRLYRKLYPFLELHSTMYIDNFSTTNRIKPKFNKFIVLFYLEVPIRDIYRILRREVKNRSKI